VDQARLTTLADLLVSQGRHEEALAVLKDLSARDARNLRLLRLRLQAEQAMRLWDAVLDTVDALAQLGGIGPPSGNGAARGTPGQPGARFARRRLACGLLEQLPSEMRNDPIVRATAARYHLALGSPGPAQAILEQALEREWNTALVALYGEAAGEDALPQIERAEKWLRAHARDPALLLALGKLCMRQGLWGKAQSYIEASIALEPTHDGHMTLAALMEKIGKPRRQCCISARAPSWPARQRGAPTKEKTHARVLCTEGATAAPGARVVAPEGPERVTLDDPAFAVMTDLRNVPAASTTPGESIARRTSR
jgi:HemY protein